MDVKGIWCKGMEKIRVAQNRDQWWALVRTVPKKGRGFLD
jgi:hypothetical protein